MSRLRISACEKILVGGDYRRVMNRGVKHVNTYFVLLGIPAERRRVGIIVSKKVGRAVVRSRVKRRIRECYRTTPLWLGPTRQDQWHQRLWPQMEFVIIARKRCAEIDFQRLSSHLTQSIIALQGRIHQQQKKQAQHRLPQCPESRYGEQHTKMPTRQIPMS